MKTLLDILNLSSHYLKEKGIVNPKRQAEEIVADALGIKRMQLYLDHDRPLEGIELDLCRKHLARRGEGEPSAYIRGFVEFADCKILVSKAALIPRQETEILVEKICTELSEENLEGKVLWDLCSGSGCIGIALKKKFPNLNVLCSDIAPEAIELAMKSAHENQTNITFLQGNLLQPFKDLKTDFVVCNPPYVSAQEYLELDREVKDFEPMGALLGGSDGLEFYRRLQQSLPTHLNPKAKVWLEIGWKQGEAVRELFKPPIWKSCRLEQ